jgi:peptide/nickel transport system substrate-binding protein
MTKSAMTALAIGAGVALAIGSGTGALAKMPKRGGILNFVVASKIPSYDGHKESTFGMIHPIRPFYSLLIRVDPNNPQTNDFVCDLCDGKVPEPTNGGKRYTFKIHKGIKFHDGTPLTAHDIVATHNKIIFPAPGVASSRKGFFSMVEKISAPDDYTVVFDLKYATPGFLPALATPFNFTYAKADLDKHGMSWHEKHINGTGAFTFVQHQPGAFVEGKKYDHYHHMGADGKPLPYLDGYKAISAPKMAVRVQAIRGDRAAIEFRGFPPKTRDDLVKALGDKITVQEGDWNCVMGASPNQNTKTKGDKYKDPRVRRALSMALDRWEGSKYLSKIALVRTVGGIAFPKHPLAATKEELMQMAPYNPDREARHAAAKKLLADAGKTDFKVTLWNRAVDQPYKVVGTWYIDQWRKIGLDADQVVLPSGPWYAGFRKKKDYDVTVDFNCQSVVNPTVDAAKWISDDKTGNNYASYQDRTLDKWYDEMNRETDFKKQRAIFRKFEKRVLDEQAHFILAFWWYKINPHRSYVKGWIQAPSHYLNQHLDQVWLDK